MPQLKHSFTLLSSANAVKATIGLRNFKLFLMIFVAVKPSIFGICTSMKMMSYRDIVSYDFFTRSTASAPLAAMVMLVKPSSFNILLMTSWFTELSSATKILRCEISSRHVSPVGV
ncbi:hypothetical protein HF325_003109 [Metschnikowia pulcherrima]|uniref:Uncharacterized protein n=1 Tax=Metschnikowia pulcherrima TaxID=27326 RepID=A0A8H7LBD1_9ASCO|nr:hypothetical protein HF325_003109 [Metschnikowia pulcherrima]